MKLIPWKRREDLSRPAEDFTNFGRDFDSLLSAFFGPQSLSFGAADHLPSLDLRETKDEVVVKADLPGMDKKDIQVTVKDSALHISGERREEEDSEEGDWHRSERSWGSFYRSVSLPEGVKEDKVRAEYKDGVLTVRLAKDEAKKAKTINIE